LGELFVQKKGAKRGILDTLAHSLPKPVKTLLKSQAASPIHGQFSLHTAGGSVTAELSRPKTDMEISQRINSSYSCRCSFSSLHSSHRQKQPGFL